MTIETGVVVCCYYYAYPTAVNVPMGQILRTLTVATQSGHVDLYTQNDALNGQPDLAAQFDRLLSIDGPGGFSKGCIPKGRKVCFVRRVSLGGLAMHEGGVKL